MIRKFALCSLLDVVSGSSSISTVVEILFRADKILRGVCLVCVSPTDLISTCVHMVLHVAPKLCAEIRIIGLWKRNGKVYVCMCVCVHRLNQSS